jgi:hypothetical protein
VSTEEALGEEARALLAHLVKGYFTISKHYAPPPNYGIVLLSLLD